MTILQDRICFCCVGWSMCCLFGRLTHALGVQPVTLQTDNALVIIRSNSRAWQYPKPSHPAHHPSTNRCPPNDLAIDQLYSPPQSLSMYPPSHHNQTTANPQKPTYKNHLHVTTIHVPRCQKAVCTTQNAHPCSCQRCDYVTM